MKLAGLCFALATFGAQHNFHLEHNRDGFGMRPHGVIEVVNGHEKFYPLPQSTWEDYVRLRPKDVTMNPLAATNGTYEREEVIGPYQLEGGKLWFGKSFYDGEGERGVERSVISIPRRASTSFSRRRRLLRMKPALSWWSRIRSGSGSIFSRKTSPHFRVVW